MTGAITRKLVEECLRQAESCAYTGAGLYVWQKFARWWRAVFLIAPIVLGGIAGSQILVGGEGDVRKFIGTACGLLAGFFPAIYIALNMDMRVSEIGRAASEFTNLRDRFRQAANIKSLNTPDDFQAQFEGLMDRMDAARNTAPAMPEWCFKRAQKKINAGDYKFEVDNASTEGR